MSDTTDPYQALVMDRARAPRHAGRLPVFTAEAKGNNPTCGDRTHLFLNLQDNRVAAAAHVSCGCTIMTASADLMAEAVQGLTTSAFGQLRTAFEALVTTGTPNPSLGNLNALAGVSDYRSRIRCATLPWSALAEALQAAELEPTHG